ncbi:hypothetical protein OUZ56_001748 [Daphnia magna]|uniref:Uncharacterized protein n=1 Tax=Daphnia magna TaxID=35525 RepID=A0ABR0A3M4_9CRUS|nr:hypothetical protein OUZ56_001748 [Daphnia magna]
MFMMEESVMIKRFFRFTVYRVGWPADPNLIIVEWELSINHPVYDPALFGPRGSGRAIRDIRIESPVWGHASIITDGSCFSCILEGRKI